MNSRLTFRKRQRIHRQSDFARIMRRRCSAGDDRLVVYVDHPGAAWARIGVRAGKRLGHAVARNRAKRRVKEAFRLNQPALPALDMVCVLRRADASLEEYAQSLRHLVERAAARLGRVRVQ